MGPSEHTSKGRLLAGTALLAGLGGGALWAGVDSYCAVLDQIERGIPWIAIRRGDPVLPGLGLALSLLVPFGFASSIGRSLRSPLAATLWMGVGAGLILAGVGWWSGADYLRSRAESAGYAVCSDLDRYGFREAGKYWARSEELCPPPNAGNPPD